MQGAVSGLNRGLAANEEDLRRAESAAKDLEALGGVDLTKDLDKLQGRWKLIYSSAFSSRTLGGSRPGPPTGRLLPITLGQVRLDVRSGPCFFSPFFKIFLTGCQRRTLVNISNRFHN